MKKLPIIEIFGPTIQGEGQLAGKRSHFVRFGGCGYRCTWCDSMHAVDPAQVKVNRKLMSEEEIVNSLKVLALPFDCPVVTLSGGDPVMWDLTLLIEILRLEGYKVAIETQGQFYKPWIADINYITVSPKPPSSGMQDKLDIAVLKEYISNINNNLAFKFVVQDKRDVEWAVYIWNRLPETHRLPLYLSACTDIHDPSANDEDQLKLNICNRLRWLYEESLKHHELWEAVILPQLHVLAWGNKLGV